MGGIANSRGAQRSVLRQARISTNLENQSVYNVRMGNRVIHISASEAVSDFGALLDHVRAGDDVIIEHDSRPVAVLRPAAPPSSLGEAFAAIAREVPDEDWKRVPSDLASNLDPHLYGTSA
jgi:prevent-host-death family protein